MKSIILICTALSLFLSILVFIKKQKTYSNYLLAFWLIFIAIHAASEYLQFYNFEHDFPFPWLIGINITFGAVHPIWIFLYILSYIRPRTDNLRSLWHLLPILLLNILLLKTFYLKSGIEKINLFNTIIEGVGTTDTGYELSVYLVISIILGYLLAAYLLLKRHVKNVRNHFSNLEGVDLKWLRVVLFCTGIVLVVAIIQDWITKHTTIISTNEGTTIVFICVAFGIAYIGIHGIRQTDIFVDIKTIDQEWDMPVYFNKKNVSYSKNDPSLMDSFISEKYEKLIRCMEESKPYLDSNLNLQVLAEQLDIKPHLLSHMINQKAGKNFFDFVNSYRINEFKTRIRQPDNKNYTLLSIAYECGFNSKTTFNRVFKNHSGYTPSEFFQNPQLG